MANFGTILKKLRIQKGVSHKEVGDLIDVSESSIRKYESNDRTPTPDAIIKIANFFDVTTDYLLGQDTLNMQKAFNVSTEDLELLNQIKKASPKKRKAIELILEIEEKIMDKT